ncbi:MAG: hypothetical protein ACJ74D_04165 [Gaiellaceae bacterium]
MRPDWTRFSGFGVEFSYPASAERDEAADIVHVHSADRQELYFEVARFRGLTPQQEYARHRPYLEQRFGPGAVTELTATNLGNTPAWTYSFNWDEEGSAMERTAVLLQLGPDTCRIIRDPRSVLNDEVLASVVLLP